MKLALPLSRDTVTSIGILLNIWLYGSKSYPSPRHISQKLDSMFGAQLQKYVNKNGERLIININVKTLNDHSELNINNLDSEVVNLLFELLNNPITDEASFDSSIVEQQKKWSLKQLKRRFDSAESYAMWKCLNLSSVAGDSGIISELGYEVDYDSITGKSLFQLHEEVIKNSEVHIYITGDFMNIEDTITSYTEVFHNFYINTFSTVNEKKINSVQENMNETLRPKKTPKKIVEYKEINHSVLTISFLTGINLSSKNYMPLMLFIYFLWGLPKSKLLVNVREKKGLAYQITVKHDSSMGILVIQLGVEAKEWEMAHDAVLREIELIKNGAFDEKEFTEFRQLLKSLWIQQMDNAETLVNLDFTRRLQGQTFQISFFLDAIDLISKEDLIEVANMVNEDCIHLLHNDYWRGSFERL